MGKFYVSSKVFKGITRLSRERMYEYERGINTLRMTKWMFSGLIAILLLSSVLSSRGLASSLKDWQNEKKLLEKKKKQFKFNDRSKEERNKSK